MNAFIGIGNALVDIMARLSNEDILQRFNLPKGSMTLVDRELSNLMNMETSALKKTKSSGGSAANTIHGLANLGIETAYVGKIGKDDLGNFFLKDMENAGIKPILYHSFNDTGRVMAFISPDAERTMATYLGAAVELSDQDITSDIFKGYQYLYIEGYLINNLELVTKSIRLAKKSHLRVCLDLASYNIVEEYRNELLHSVLPEVDIIFANEEEAKSLTGLDADAALHTIASLCNIAVVKTGPQGSLVKQGEKEFHVPALPVNSVDTTGAGDIYAAGFMFGESTGKDLETAARIGTLLASEVIGQMGAKLSPEQWARMRTRIDAGDFN